MSDVEESLKVATKIAEFAAREVARFRLSLTPFASSPHLRAIIAGTVGSHILTLRAEFAAEARAADKAEDAANG